jgi:hypothetical protein
VLQCVTNLLSGKEKYVSPLTSLYPQAAQILRLGPGLLSMSPDTASAVETTNKVITKRHIPALIKRSTGFEGFRRLVTGQKLPIRIRYSARSTPMFGKKPFKNKTKQK